MVSPEDISPGELTERQIGPVSVLFGYENGKFPYGNAFTVRGEKTSLLVDPGLGLIARKDNLPDVDMVFYSHTHEDHVAGAHLFPDTPCYAHSLDALGLRSIDGLMQMYGISGTVLRDFRRHVETSFYYQARPDVITFEDGDVFDLGGVTLKVIHTPGHTRGHCCFLVSWGDAGPEQQFVYLGDIDLTGFGPYYGDAWSDLEDFERSIDTIRNIDAAWWLTFHHKGLLEGRSNFLELLDIFENMIALREENLISYLSEPRTIEEIVAHRFVFRPGNEGLMIDAVEKRSMSMHLDRLMRSGLVKMEEGRFSAL
jgi:glyoxylase-like metal-dependent hydrolase (beta-lactamase superfamily II)